MHTVGFFHEQSRYDREQFIQILWTNVVNGADDQFEKYGVNVIDQLNEPYDYASIMYVHLLFIRISMCIFILDL